MGVCLCEHVCVCVREEKQSRREEEAEEEAEDWGFCERRASRRVRD